MGGMATPLYLTSPQLVAAVEKLEGERLPLRTLAHWAYSNVLVPSVEWQRKRRATRLYTLRDMARARLIVRLRKHLSMPKVRIALAALDAAGDTRELFRRNANVALFYQEWRGEVVTVRPGEAPRATSGQLYLPLWEFMRGNVEAAREAKRAAA